MRTIEEVGKSGDGAVLNNMCMTNGTTVLLRFQLLAAYVGNNLPGTARNRRKPNGRLLPTLTPQFVSDVSL